MTIEEKARAYDKALKRARALYSQGAPDSLTLESMFPELKESEGEKIRKELIEHCKNQAKPYIDTGNECPQIQSWINWLEKQGEQKATDNNKPKFKVGDKVCAISNRFECTIESIDESTYYGDTTNFDIKDQDKWKLIEQKPTEQVEPKFKVGDFIVNDYCMGRVVELTNDAYLLDTEQGIPFSCEHNVHLWTIEDAKEGDVLVNGDEIVIFKKNSFNEKDLSGCMFVHCSLRDKKGSWYTIGGINPSNYLPATKAQRDKLFKAMKEVGYVWNMEKKELKKINSYCQEHCKGYQETGKCYADGECEAKKNAETGWSEEDKGFLNLLLAIFTNEHPNGIFSTDNIPVFNGYCVPSRRIIDWLKSLKPQTTWKPSDEQLYFLHWLATNVLTHGEVEKKASEVLESLYNDLKKLIE